MLAAQKAVATALAPKSAATETGGAARRKADRAIDAAWSAFFDWLSGWCKLEGSENPRREEALALQAQLFPDALGFTRLPFRVEWTESKARIDAIRSNKLDAIIIALGGKPFLKRLYRAQKAYGDALGITAVPSATPESPDVRARMDEALAVLRQYAVQVVSHVDSDDSSSQKLSEELLRPLMEWEDTSVGAASEDDEPDVGAAEDDMNDGADDPKDEASGGEGGGSPPKK